MTLFLVDALNIRGMQDKKLRELIRIKEVYSKMLRSP